MEETLVSVSTGNGNGSGSGASKTMRAGRKMYFFDAKESKNGNRYLQITESCQDQNGERKRSSIFLFPDQVEQFQQALSEVAARL